MKKSQLLGVMGVVIAIGALAWIWYATVQDRKTAGSEQENSGQNEARQLLAQAVVCNSISEILAQCEFSVNVGRANVLKSWPFVRAIANEWRPSAACYDIRSAARVYSDTGTTVLGWMYVFSNSEDHESLVIVATAEGVSSVATIPNGFSFLRRAPIEEIAVEPESENAVVLGVDMSDTTLVIIADYTQETVGSGYPIQWRTEYTYTYIDAVSGASVEDQLSESARSLITDCIHAPEVARGMPESESDHDGKATYVFYEYGKVVRAFRADWLRKDDDTAKGTE